MRTRLNVNSETLKRSNISRAAEIMMVMEGIYGPETEADEARPTEEEKSQTRNLPAMRLHLADDPRPLPPLPEGT